MIFRKAKKEDIPAITAIYDLIHTEEEAGRATIGWVRDIYPTEADANMALQRGDLFLGEDNGIIFGAAIINQLQVDVYEKAPWEYPADHHDVMVLHTLVVSPRAPRQGYGQAFVSFYESYAKASGCTCLRMDTNEKNTRARAMYKKLGFREIAVVPCDFNGIRSIQLVLLEKKLS